MRLSFMVFTPSGLLMKGRLTDVSADAFLARVRENVAASTILYAEEIARASRAKEREAGRPIYIARAVEIKSSVRRAHPRGAARILHRMKRARAAISFFLRDFYNIRVPMGDNVSLIKRRRILSRARRRRPVRRVPRTPARRR
jgi:hypothetical protein